MAFSVWLLSVMFLRFIHVVVSVFHFFLWLNNVPLCIDGPHLTCTAPDEHLPCFHLFTFMNDAPVNISVHIFV